MQPLNPFNATTEGMGTLQNLLGIVYKSDWKNGKSGGKVSEKETSKLEKYRKSRRKVQEMYRKSIGKVGEKLFDEISKFFLA